MLIGSSKLHKYFVEAAKKLDLADKLSKKNKSSKLLT